MMRQLLTENETAEQLNLAPHTLAKWRMHGEHLPFVRIGRRIAYHRDDINEFISRNRVSSTSQKVG